ncbi:sugar phosphate isomerase/epimerase family protein [Saccharothrix deserti]|uniref:sugar phosphate isomerase/epimerase family protein n=1 Tax=Saccharothrix deserti TaxID=2593674 RepID=UPI00131E1A90|nr:sugar phosphate isomerase/epimerase family protein [Saccharothrix deserti]
MNRARIGLVDWRLPVSGPRAVVLAAELGADGIQLDLGGPGRAPWLDERERLRELRAVLADTGVVPLAVSANTLNDIGLTAADGTAAAERVRQVVDRALDVAVEIGAGLVFLPSFRRSAIDGPSALARTAEVLRWACAEARRRNLLLANENVLAPPDLRELIEQVGSPALRVVLDTGNLAVSGVDPVAVVREAGPVLADQVHVKSAADRKPLTSADSAVVEALAEVGRAGVVINALVLENDYRDGDFVRVSADLDWLKARFAIRSPGGDAAA